VQSLLPYGDIGLLRGAWLLIIQVCEHNLLWGGNDWPLAIWADDPLAHLVIPKMNHQRMVAAVVCALNQGHLVSKDMEFQGQLNQ
jgi:hypothetical protein